MPELLFLSPLFSLLFLLPLLLFSLWKRFAVKRSTIYLGTSVEGLPRTPRQRFRFLVPLLYSLGWLSLVVALMRPVELKLNPIERDGPPLMIVLDRSSSMGIKATRYEPTRLELAKELFLEFVKQNPQSAIGFITFAKHANTISPLTFSHTTLSSFVKYITLATQKEDGTAIGDAVALASARLVEAYGEKELTEKGAGAMIVLTDGESNIGLSPLEAAKLAQKYKIRIYAISMSDRSSFESRIQTLLGNLENRVLKEITEQTQGAYFTANSFEELEEAYRSITELEIPDIEQRRKDIIRVERYHPWVILALLLFLTAWFLSVTWLRRI